ncbi:labile enterotoxin output A [Burkholderia sp. Leaf177]|uniref:LeoA/HP0731 family dynamin-like GTPase n=1 Tax=Burkholderia sp. Leaf177 TaxID=1736287 RepID=UPI0006FA7DF0|nr:LeoA/HP0731 family dynamin-like GTPase [Burkholderia sp. Leaf177]KQR81598.1 labile enterotoxin output A [Burkholderia sp. Leaf177]
MRETVQSHKERQSETLGVLQELEKFLTEGEAFGIDVDSSLKAKLDNAIESFQDNTLRIALIGGFSEGKTAIAAAWLERLDKSTMKISHEESSNAVTVYQAGPECLLIDTPGLFGFKEQENDTTHAIEKYKELTRKFVSEAHLVLYVMDPANPIKASHADDLNWLFRELNLLPRTVFVLSRFDAVADVEDERDYGRNLAIKKENVAGRLRDLIALNDVEAANLAVVAVAADPFEMGTEHWLSDLDRFRALSRIALLQEATSKKVSAAGGIAAVVDEAKRSIVRDVLGEQLPIALEQDDKIAQEVLQLATISRQLKTQLGTASGRITESQIGLREFNVRFFADLILQAGGLTLETFPEFFERQIGSGGVVLNANLQNAFDRQLSSARLEVDKMAVGFVAEVNHFNETVLACGKQGLKYVVKSGLINNTSVLAARDGMVGVAKVIGLDIGQMLKFKPWGAVKLAKGFNGALSFIGLALEAWDSYDKMKREKAFREMVANMTEKLKRQRDELLVLIDSDQFEAQFFPEMTALRRDVDAVERSVAEGGERRARFRTWCERGHAIEVEFHLLDAA